MECLIEFYKKMASPSGVIRPRKFIQNMKYTTDLTNKFITVTEKNKLLKKEGDKLKTDVEKLKTDVQKLKMQIKMLKQFST